MEGINLKRGVYVNFTSFAKYRVDIRARFVAKNARQKTGHDHTFRLRF